MMHKEAEMSVEELKAMYAKMADNAAKIENTKEEVKKEVILFTRFIYEHIKVFYSDEFRTMNQCLI